MTPYQAQYFWHSARQHPGRDASPLEVLADLPRPLALVAWVGVFVWLAIRLVMLAALLVIAAVFVVAFVQTV